MQHYCTVRKKSHLCTILFAPNRPASVALCPINKAPPQMNPTYRRPQPGFGVTAARSVVSNYAAYMYKHDAGDLPEPFFFSAHMISLRSLALCIRETWPRKDPASRTVCKTKGNYRANAKLPPKRVLYDIIDDNIPYCTVGE